jgi:hypothetical protein
LSPDFIRDNVLLFGPGFVFTKLIYLFGQQHRRQEWEWLVWSLITGLPIAFVAEAIATQSWPESVPTTQDVTHAALGFVVAIVGGLVVAWAWRHLRHLRLRPFPFVLRSISDSAWDFVLDRAHHDGCGLAVTVAYTTDEGKTTEMSYLGALSAFGYEAASAEPIVALRDVQRWNGETKAWQPMAPTGNRMIFNRDKILRMRIVSKPDARTSADTGVSSAASSPDLAPLPDIAPSA